MKKRKDIKHIGKFDSRVLSMAKMGGYYKWSWKFPFIKFVEDRIIVATENGVYTITSDDAKN